MIIPATDPEAAAGSAAPPAERLEWTRLEPSAKRERLLEAATDVFARDGLDAPMSVVAEAAGAGVASVYRLFGSKRELLAALVTRRMDEVAVAAQEACAQPGDRWSALTEMLTTLVSGQRADYLIGDARAVVADHPDVIAAVTRASEAQERLLAAARTEGRLRADATPQDLRLLFAATRAARRVEPAQWGRMLELMLDALDARRGSADQ
ncbi:MAG TPA: TetR family transcriptional regulator [Solirubrobacteraceae bacterium]|jgi:AcrR family transcriptional regulator